MSEKLLNGYEVAEMLNISKSKAFSLMRHGEIATIKFGKSVRVRQQDLDEYILQNRVTTCSPEKDAGVG